MAILDTIFKRTELLLGSDVLNQLKEKKVIIFGVGGVGSWCAEALVRTGIQHLTIVDFDTVCPTNINRQLMANTKTVGEEKVYLLKNRLLEVNPEANIIAKKEIYSKENADSFGLDDFDYIIDAIDSLENKVHLIQTATNTKATFFSSMGAALKMDPTRVRVADFWKVQGCPLGSALRRKLRKSEMPKKHFKAVYSDELNENRGADILSELKDIPATGEADATLGKKGLPNGTVVFVTATFGLTLASLVVQDVITKSDHEQK